MSTPIKRIANINNKISEPSPKRTLLERPINDNVNDTSVTNMTQAPRVIDQEIKPLSFTLELMDRLKAANQDAKDYIANNMDSAGGELQIYGWSRGKYIDSSFYDKLFTPDLNIKKVMLRGRGTWETCHCPKMTNGIDRAIPKLKTNLEHLYIMKTFNISACALLDLVARSPKLKTVRFYGVLTHVEGHPEAFKIEKFPGQLEGVYWPWCSKKLHLPTLQALLKGNDKITTFYSTGFVTCELLGSDYLPNLRHLSLLLNESWQCKPSYSKKASRYVKKLPYLSNAKKLESLEVRTFDLDIDEDDRECEEINKVVKQLNEEYQLQFWIQIAKLTELKFLAIYGSWELDKVCHQLARHGIQIEYFKTNLLQGNLHHLIGDPDNDLLLSMDESLRQLRKLAKLRSIHYVCHDKLIGIDKASVTALKEVSDLIWSFDIQTKFTEDVEDLLALMLKRANQSGKTYMISLAIESAESHHANFYHETLLKHSTGLNLRKRIENTVEMATKERYGKSNYRDFRLWGIKQVSSSRDRTTFEHLKAVWDRYNDIYNPVDKFV